jgi:hypothetical protein
MNIDDPKLTAFALDELGEPEKSAIAREIAESLEAQRYVQETREFATELKNEFQTEVANNKSILAPTRRSFVDIREEPWFWSAARPLALAAAIAVLVILGAVVLGNYKSRSNITSSNPIRGREIVAEQTPEIASEVGEPDEVPNPLRPDVVQHIERVVIGELGADPHLENGELHLIEVINDAYRIKHLKQRLTIPTVSKRSYRGLAGRGYELMFLDHAGHVVASAHFYRTPEFRFVLQPRKEAFERNGRYFVGGDSVLPGSWQSSVDYSWYAIDFPDWGECVGYAPGA